ncbi:MAG: winged helix-turn-helix domain-containing protein [Nitrososphaerales archaeon]|jgi:DNA-binding transcriptional regulator GbsR (MarR family)
MSLNGSGRLTAFVSKSEVRSKVLVHLSRGPMTPTELASIERKHVSHVSRALAELCAEGLVEPISASTRARYYRATDRGLTLGLQFMKIAK